MAETVKEGQRLRRGERRGGRPTTSQSESLSEDILSAAEASFLRFGYFDTNFDRIALDAQTTRSAIYKRFENKSALFVAVGRRVLVRHFDYDTNAPDSDLPLLEGLRTIAMALIDAGTDPESLALYKMLSAGAPNNPEFLEIVQGEMDFYTAQLVRFFRDRVERGTLHLKDPEAAASLFTIMLLAQIESAIVQNADLPSRETSVRYINDITLIFLGGIGRFELERDH